MSSRLKTTRSTKNLPAIAGGTAVRDARRPLVFGAPVLGQKEIDALADCLKSRWIGLGPAVSKFEKQFAVYKSAPYALATNSGTSALHLALVGLEIGPGDEVIAPTMTFCSTIHSIVHTGAIPVLADCRRSTSNIEPEEIERRITARSKAIVVVHMAGRPCEMDSILAIARKRGLRLIEDCAHAIEAEHRDRPVGLMGDIGCFSFYPTKNLTTGDGGMVTTKDKRLFERMKVMSRHGMTADAWTRWSRGGTGYNVVEAGFKYNMTDLDAALGLVQLQEIENRWMSRKRIWKLYNERLSNFPVSLPTVPEKGTRHAYHLYTITLDLAALGVAREKVMEALSAENIGTGIHYVPVHMQPYYSKRYGYEPSEFPNAAFLGERTLSLPLSADLTEQDVSDVCEGLERVLDYFATRANHTRGQRR